jgi:hypothetical protein
MLFHMSMPASDPRRVATVVAQLWGGEAFPFIPLAANGSWVAFAGDDRGSSIEFYPRGARILPSDEACPTGFTVSVDEDAARDDGPFAGRIATHAAVGSVLTTDEIVALASREGWLSRRAQRGRFHVVEMWLENAVMLEVLPDAFQQEYLASQTLENWRTGVAATSRRQPPASQPA